MPASGASPNAGPRRGLLFPESWPPGVLAFGVISVAALIAYHETFSAPFIFEDLPRVARNSTLRSLWPFGEPLAASPEGASLAHGPLANFSFALNYAVGGLDVRGYHAINLLLHIAAGVLLFGVVRRTFESTPLRARFGTRSVAVALVSALLWALHPLQTATVTCVSQRAAALAGLFFLLALYAFIRATEVSARRGWSLAAVSACLLGMGTTPTMVAAPVLVLLYDRTFVAGTFREAWRRHRSLHVGMMLAWLAFALRLGPAWGAGAPGSALETGAWGLVSAQCRAFALYLRLGLWPEPLVLDYGVEAVRNITENWMPALVVGSLLLLTIVALVRRPVLGFLGAWFFLTLAASSGPIWATPTLAEHHGYLALAAITTLIVATLARLHLRQGVFAGLALALLAGGLTLRRNADYESALAIWRDTVAKVPGNPRAHFHLANAWSAAGRPADAIGHYEIALRLDPRYAEAHHNLAGALLQRDRAGDAVTHYQAALRLAPNSPDTHVNLAAAFLRLGRIGDAVSHYEAASRSGLLAAEEQLKFGRALAEIGRLDDALARLREALRLNPKHAGTHLVLGMVLAAADRSVDALHHFTEAVLLDASDAGARTALGDALIDADRPAEALSHYEAALRLQPGHGAQLHTSIANAQIRLGRFGDAVVHYEEALRLNPDDAEARRNLAAVRAAAHRRGMLKN